MAYQQYHRPPPTHAQWMPMYQQPFAEDDGTYKPTGISQTLEIDNESVPSYRKQSFQQKYLGGLKRTLRAFAIAAVVVLAINVGWLAYAKSKYGIVGGYGSVSKGDCTTVKRLNTWFHLAINILSTLLLTGSNAFMAAYSSPTRQEIDKAHARRRWLHVGCVSLRNMLGISWSKSLVVFVFAVSSVPFHLLYNSLIYTELSVNNYYWSIVTEDFLTGAPFNLTDDQRAMFSDYGDDDDEITAESLLQVMQKSASTWEPLDNKACIQAYSNAFLSDRRNVVLVSSTQNSSNSVLDVGAAELGYGSDIVNNWWICSELGNDGGHMSCNPHKYLADAGSWQVFGYPIERCLSEKTQDSCEVKFSMNIMVVVVAFNAVKVLAMCWILLRLDASQLITCVGDAAASFIRHPDQTTMGMCLTDRRNIESSWRMPVPRVYNGIRRQWGSAISRKRWILFTLLMLSAWLAVLFFGTWGFVHTKDEGIDLTPSGLWSLGFGTINQHAMVFASSTDAPNPLLTSILANIPQVFLAMIYLMYMGVMTAMFNAVDWARFAKQPQTLMVSSATGQQRGTWLLGAPIAYGLSLLALQTLLHWFVSQSIFVVQMTVLDGWGNVDLTIAPQSNCGYSPVAIVCSVVASGVLYLSAIIFMLRRQPPGSAPVVSTCSAAISAACHVPGNLMSDAVVFEKLQWGATMEGFNAVGHCSLGPAKAFEGGWAGPPVQGKAYAGVSEKKKR